MKIYRSQKSRNSNIKIDGWLFKMIMALIDTPIIYGIIYLLKGKIDIAEIKS